jgi:hypothetical protein
MVDTMLNVCTNQRSYPIVQRGLFMAHRDALGLNGIENSVEPVHGNADGTLAFRNKSDNLIWHRSENTYSSRLISTFPRLDVASALNPIATGLYNTSTPIHLAHV